jgi:hypothetical protein
MEVVMFHSVDDLLVDWRVDMVIQARSNHGQQH